MVEHLTMLRSVLPQQPPLGERTPFLKKPEISPNFSAKEILRIAAGTGLVLVGCAMILDGSINNSNLETIGGAIFIIGGIYVLTKK